MLSDGTANYLSGQERLRALGGPWYVGDALGSVRQTLDDAGAVLATTNYDPWGTPQGTENLPVMAIARNAGNADEVINALAVPDGGSRPNQRRSGRLRAVWNGRPTHMLAGQVIGEAHAQIGTCGGEDPLDRGRSRIRMVGHPVSCGTVQFLTHRQPSCRR